MATLLANGKYVKNGTEMTVHVLVEDGRIEKIWESSEPPHTEKNTETIDLKGKLISAGFIDMHVHLRDPGFEAKEDIVTGTRAAARGGFTTVACMPNSRPVTDNPETVTYIREKADKQGSARVLPMGAITVRELGKELTDMQALKEAGVVALSDDGVGVQEGRMMMDAMAEATKLGLPVVAHCEDNSLARGGAIHQGSYAEKHGIRGIPNEAESVHIARDILLAEATGAHYHVCHISTEQSVWMVREAKARGINVTAEVCPHHLLLTDEDIPAPDADGRVNTDFKMNPPLRSERDRQALLEGLKDGTIDIIVTDHAPHTREEKDQDIYRAPFGIVGLETAFPLLYTHLVKTGMFTLEEILYRMTRKPAELFGLPWGELKEGAPADITVIDLETEKQVDREKFLSKGKNTPFHGWKLKGWPVMTMLNGQIVWQEENFIKERG
ncbi:MAG: dihydroorotase [Bacillaceae bacterium]|nr:dihydroorotase [Bacillaceae bacterium]